MTPGLSKEPLRLRPMIKLLKTNNIEYTINYWTARRK